MNVTKENIDEAIKDLLYEFKVGDNVEFDNLPIPFDADLALQFIATQTTKMMRVIRIAAGVALIRGSDKVASEDYEMAIRIEAEGLHRFVGFSSSW